MEVRLIMQKIEDFTRKLLDFVKNLGSLQPFVITLCEHFESEKFDNKNYKANKEK